MHSKMRISEVTWYISFLVFVFLAVNYSSCDASSPVDCTFAKDSCQWTLSGWNQDGDHITTSRSSTKHNLTSGVMKVDSVKSFCLRFQFKISDKTEAANLHVLVPQKKFTWNVQLPDTPEWNDASLTIPMDSDFQIAFRSEWCPNQKTVMSLRNVIIEESPCEKASGTTRVTATQSQVSTCGTASFRFQAMVLTVCFVVFAMMYL